MYPHSLLIRLGFPDVKGHLGAVRRHSDVFPSHSRQRRTNSKAEAVSVLGEGHFTWLEVKEVRVLGEVVQLNFGGTVSFGLVSQHRSLS